MRILIAAALLFTSAAYAQTELETLLCVSEKSTGFKFLNNAWQDVFFNSTEDKYIVSPADEEGAYTVTRIGQLEVISNCNRLSYDGEFWPRMHCGGPLSSFAFNFEKLRFQRYYGFGYIEGDDKDGADTPFVTIGKCSVIPS